MRAVAAVPAVLCLLAACSTEPRVKLLDPITPSAEVVRTGGTLDLHSRSFIGSDAVPQVRFAGGDWLPVTAADTYIARVQLPADTCGRFVLQVALPSGSDFTDVPLFELDTIVATRLPEWPGGTLDLHSRCFIGADRTPLVRIRDGDTLAVSALDTHLVRVQLPPGVNGRVELLATLAQAYDVPATTLTLQAGYRTWFPGGPLLGNPQRVPGTTLLMGYGDSGLVRYDARTGIAERLLPDSLSGVGRGGQLCSYATGMSLVPGTVTSSAEWGGRGCRLLEWDLTRSAIVDSFDFNAGFAWAAIHAGAGRWLVNGKHDSYGLTAPATETWLGQLEEPLEFVVDPTHTLAVGDYGASNVGGTPVYDLSSLQVRYRVADVGLSFATGFSPRGDTLYMTGGPNFFRPPYFIRAVDAATGRELASDSLGLDWTFMAVDSSGPWLYFVGGEAGRPAVRVVDRTTLKQVGHLTADASAPALGYDILYPVLDQAARRLYVVDMQIRNGPLSKVYVFDLLP